MIKALSLAALAATSLAGGVAQAHGYGYNREDLPPAPYANDGHEYAVGGRVEHKGFPLLGANAGVTVLGVHLGASGALRLSVADELRERHHRRVVVRRYAAPEAREFRGEERRYEDERGRW